MRGAFSLIFMREKVTCEITTFIKRKLVTYQNLKQKQKTKNKILRTNNVNGTMKNKTLIADNLECK